MAFHPDVERFLTESRRLSDTIGAIQTAAFDGLRVRRAAPDDPDVMPEVDGWGELKDLYLGDGVVDRYRPAQLERVILSALQECYAVLGERRSAAAHDAVPDLDPEFGFGSPTTNDQQPGGTDTIDESQRG